MKSILTLIILLSLGAYANEHVHESEHAHEEEHEHDEHDDHDEHAHEGGKAIGKGKAITKVDEALGFSLSDEAMQTLDVKLASLSKAEFAIPKDALVVSLDRKGVYRLRNGFFKFVSVKIVSKTQESFNVNIGEIMNGDQVAIKNVGLLRVADIYSTDKSEYGHGH